MGAFGDACDCEVGVEGVVGVPGGGVSIISGIFCSDGGTSTVDRPLELIRECHCRECVGALALFDGSDEAGS